MAKVTSTVSDELKEIIKEEANEEDKSQSQVVREALVHYYDQESESSDELEEKEQKIENQKKMIRDLEMKIDEIKERKNRELAKKEEEIMELEEKFEDQKGSSGLFEMVKDTFSADWFCYYFLFVMIFGFKIRLKFFLLYYCFSFFGNWI